MAARIRANTILQPMQFENITIFMKLGTFVHFIGNSNLEKIWVDTDIFVGVMTSSKKKCGGGPPINLITSEIC